MMKRNSEEIDNEQEHGVGYSLVELRAREGAVELEFRIEEGDVEPGIYDVSFSCTNPNVSRVFADALALDEDGEGEFGTEIELEDGTYEDCQVAFETVVVNFEPFTVTG